MRFIKLGIAIVALTLVLTGLSAALSRTLIPVNLEGSVAARRPTGEWPSTSSDTWYVTVGEQTYVASSEAADVLEAGIQVDKPPWRRDLDGPGSPRLEVGGDPQRLGAPYLVVLTALLLLLGQRARSDEGAPGGMKEHATKRKAE